MLCYFLLYSSESVTCVCICICIPAFFVYSFQRSFL